MKTDTPITYRQTQRRHQWWAKLIIEFPQTFSWTWILPILIIGMSLALARSAPPPSITEEETTEGSRPSTIVEIEYTDFATSLRQDLELYLPLVGVFLVIPLIAKEWQHGTITQIAMRTPLAYTLFRRLSIVILYLLLIIAIATSASMLRTLYPPENGNIPFWYWQTLYTIAPTFFASIALGLLIAVLSVSVITGYLTVVALWVLNFVMIRILTQGNIAANDLILYTWSGWQYHKTALHPEQWWIGKIIWLGIGIVCLCSTFILLRHETRLIRNVSD